MDRVIILSAVAMLTFTTSALAELPITDPAVACGLMRDAGLQTRRWFTDDGSFYWCASDYKYIGKAYPNPNNLAYYVEGEKTSANLMKIVLNVFDQSSLKTTHASLLFAAQELHMKLFDAELPGSYADAIHRGATISGKIGETSIEVVRYNWPSGTGYEIKLIYR